MMVTFVSQCEKKALSRTRRVLDAFADRIGDNTWQTVVTQEGLLAVKKLLRKTASKNTAVSCHWIRSRSRSELVWVVGNKNKFNEQGLVPVNSTQVNRILSDEKADWRYLPLIQALAALAALLHDWGKASERFQQKIAKDFRGKRWDALRHEWVSCLLLKAFVGSGNKDTDWLGRLADGTIDVETLRQGNLATKDRPLAELPPAAQLVAWLIVSHHRLPFKKENVATKAENIEQMLAAVDKSWGYANEGDIAACLRFPKGLLADSSRWIKSIKRWAGKLATMQHNIDEVIGNGSYRLILHHARLCLMLADHSYSSMNSDSKWQGGLGLIANTHRKDGSPKQTLDQHLVRVCDYTKTNACNLPVFEKEALRSFETAQLKKPSPYLKGTYDFRWQDTAVKKINNWRTELNDRKHGFFAVNMASTGCGKTFANAKVMRALSEDGDSLRFILALGLRTLTLQTGNEYREKIFPQSDGSDLAVMIGSKAIKQLHEDQQAEENERENIGSGSESCEALLAAGDHIEYEGEIPEDGLTAVLNTNKDRQFLHAPVLACTIDHIMPASETTRGGRYILPCLRLMSSDLVIDEIDDFVNSDAIAISRLIHLAGMLGRKVMISSATITPATAAGYYKAYQAGWQLYALTRNTANTIGCAWIDEFRTSVHSLSCNDAQQSQYQFAQCHDSFVEKRVADLAKQPARRKAVIVASQALKQGSAETKAECYFLDIANVISKLHQRHCWPDPKTNINVSFGVVRTANINPCIALTRFLLSHSFEQAKNTEVRVMAYHSQQVMLLRNMQEQHLDAVLKRKEKMGTPPQALDNDVVRKHLDELAAQDQPKQNLIFIVVATPVEEVGRDHDFDWAVIEPSSYRSIIQMAGRVRRHRSGDVENENIGILQYNWKTIKDGNKERKAYFTRPGYELEDEKTQLSWQGKTIPPRCKNHDLAQLLDEKLIAQHLDAVPRIQQVPKNTRSVLAILEHAVIAQQLLNDDQDCKSINGYLNHAWWMSGLPQYYHRFRKTEPSKQLYLVSSDGETAFFTERDDDGLACRDGVYGELLNMETSNNIKRFNLSQRDLARLWLPRDYLTLLSSRANREECSLLSAAMRYGELSLRDDEGLDPYVYNDQLGLFKEKF